MDPFMAELFEIVVSGGGDSMDGANNNNNLGTTSPEPVERDEDLFPRNEEQLHPGTDMTSDGDDNNSENISTNNNNMMPEVIQHEWYELCREVLRQHMQYTCRCH
jgi:hypothetical protein